MLINNEFRLRSDRNLPNRRKGVSTVGAVFVFLSLLLILGAAASETYGDAAEDMRQVIETRVQSPLCFS